MPRRTSSRTILFQVMPPEKSGSALRTSAPSNCHLERSDQSRLGRTQLIAVGQREFRQQLFAAGREAEPHFAPIGPIARAKNPAIRFEPAAEFYGAVMPDLEPLGQDPDGCFEPGRPPLDRQQRLMLLRFDPGRTRDSLAEVQEAANFIPEVRERRVINLSWSA
jgi:hypothetical protein